MPRLDTGSESGLPSYLSILASLFSGDPTRSRRGIAKSLLLQSVRLKLITERGNARQDDQERLEGFRRGTLPLRIRPAFVFLNVICLLCLAVLGFHPRGQSYVPINDKLLHFICFLLVSTSLAAEFKSMTPKYIAFLRRPDSSTSYGTSTNQLGGCGCGATCHWYSLG